MTSKEAIKHLENMKWLKGYDNTTIGDEPLADIIDKIIELLKEQQEEINFLKAMQLKTVHNMSEQELGEIVKDVLGK